jgi:ATPase family associated with various cellular activities (AAA)
MNRILNREEIYESIKSHLLQFEENCHNTNFKKGIYIYGSSGCGKTHFATDLLKSLNYDIIKFDAGDIRNKALIDTITSDNISNKNVLDLMYKRTKKIAILMDEIDGMNNGDKGGITYLIKLIRQKKTKKQKLENMTLNPIICIGNYYVDKKIKELMKVCNVYELKTITPPQMQCLLYMKLPQFQVCDNSIIAKIVDYMQGDLRKLSFIQRLVKQKPELFNGDKESVLENILQMKCYNDNAKQITKSLINEPVTMSQHRQYMNDTDRTIISLLFHENIIDPVFTTHNNRKTSINLYSKLLENICFADFIDRITFQNQIWVFNEMSSLIKTFYNNRIYHKTFPANSGKYQPEEVRFTKVLTKYSTEYNNQLFLYNLCQELDMDKKDLIAFFQELRLLYGVGFYNNQETLNEVHALFEDTTIQKLDIKRMYRFLDKNVKTEVVSDMSSEDDDDTADNE